MKKHNEDDDRGEGGEGASIPIDDGNKKDIDAADTGSDAGISDEVAMDQRVHSVMLKNGKRTLLPMSIANLPMIDVIARLMLKGNEPFFTVSEKNGNKRVTSEAKHAAKFLSMLRQIPYLYSSAFTFPPHIEKLFEVFRTHPIRCCTCLNPRSLAFDGQLEAEVAEDFRRTYRAEADWAGTRRKLDDWDRRSETNLARLEQYLNALCNAYARIVTVRVDFYYHAASIEPEKEREVIAQAEQAHAEGVNAYLGGNDQDLPGNGLARIGIEEVMRDRDRLFENMRGKSSLFEHKIGHVWRIEYALVGGYHMHAAFFFDGSQIQQHEWLAQQICDYWREVITEGRGYAHNCNRNRYPDYVLGPTDYYDHDKRGRLLKRLAYLAKEDQLVYAKPTKKCKLFGTGRLPRAKGAGRRRSRE
ncbi:YagK/YfjJ domain-containing protein [Burkholderia savannae]|uniref:YagK/YfjJ domain-containing protein n=1 Tax=Burkholderia savannae TaxID=1637837 RepID=UPI0009E95E0D|nr:inovirus-type Gp2 protein [Burkholderia savannae]